jgi:hypothetical protein
VPNNLLALWRSLSSSSFLLPILDREIVDHLPNLALIPKASKIAGMDCISELPDLFKILKGRARMKGLCVGAIAWEGTNSC